MYLSHLRVSNIRGFGKDQVYVKLPPEPGWTVVAGRNGSGKTAVLRAVSLALVGPIAARQLVESFAGWINASAEEALVEVQVVPDSNDGFEKAGARPASFWVGLQWKKIRGEDEPILVPHLDSNPNKGRQSPERGPWSENPRGWFVAGYGPFRRLYGHAAEAQRIMSGPIQLARMGTLFREDAALGESLAWLRDLHIRELEKRPEAVELKRMVLDFLNNGLLPDPDLKIDRYDADGLWVRKKTAPAYLLRDLSDGYRAVIALVLDLLQGLNRTLRRVPKTQKTPDGVLSVCEPGVVLIDEIDAHLHVSWQRTIGPWLVSHFPFIQFVVTTHSPFVCQTAKEDGLIILPMGAGEAARIADGDLQRRVRNGSVNDALLSDLFGLKYTWSEASAEKRRKMQQLELRLFSNEATVGEKTLYNELKLELQTGPSEILADTLRRLSS